MRMTNITLRDMAVSLDNKYHSPIQYHCNYVVLLMWKSPIGNYIDERTAGFQNRMDAEEYAEYLKGRYSVMHVAYRISINGDEYFENKFYDVIDGKN